MLHRKKAIGDGRLFLEKSYFIRSIMVLWYTSLTLSGREKGPEMKKSVMYSETRTWFFDLDMAEGADLDEVMSVLKGTDGFYRYVDDGTSEEIECEWSEVPEDWRGKGDPDYTEEFREVAERELDGKERHMVLSALVKKG